MTKAKFTYRITLRPLSDDEGGGWLAEVPDLPGCMSDGETQAEALANVTDAAAGWMEAAHKAGHPIPKPGTPKTASGHVALRLPKTLHGALKSRADEDGVSLNTMLVSIISEGLGRAVTKITRRPAPERGRMGRPKNRGAKHGSKSREKDGDKVAG